MITAELKQRSIAHLKLNVSRIRKCLEFLTTDEIWKDHNEYLVSIGNLLLHLRGNVMQYIVSAVGGKEYNRERDREFMDKHDTPGSQMYALIDRTVEEACAVIEKTDRTALEKHYSVHDLDCTGIGILVHVVEHFSYHVGQITFAVKYMKNIDLGY